MRTKYKLLSFIKPYWRQLAIGFVLIIAVTLIQLLPPMLVGNILIDKILAQKNQAQLNLIILGVLLLFGFKSVVSFFMNYILSYIGQRTVFDIRNKTYHHLLEMSIAYHESQRTGDIISRLTNDIGVIQGNLTPGIVGLLTNALTLGGAIVAAFVTNPKLGLITFIISPILMIVVSRGGQRVRRGSRYAQEKVANLSTILQETLTGIRIVKAFTMEKHQAKRFSDENRANLTKNLQVAKVTSILGPIIDLLFVIILAFVFWYGCSQVIRGEMTTGKLITFILYIGVASTPLMGIVGAFNSMQAALAAGDRVSEIVDVKPEVCDMKNAVELPSIDGSLEFKNVSFGYQNEITVLKDINLIVNPGEIIALVGPSGSGKTSLVSLIPRFYDPLSGQICIDGHDLKTVKLESLRKQIGLVPQESILFRGTIRENIAFGKPHATEEEIVSAAKAANAHEFISSFNNGYDTIVGERGTTLSGGQRQRIAIARAILREPRILILDEATSSLDTESEQLVQEAMDRLMKGRTTFVIAHRLSTIQHAHKILVIDQGRIVEEGTHESLMAKNGLFRRLYEAGTHFEPETEEG